MKPLILIGAGGFGLEVVSYIQDCMNAGWGEYEVKGFLDDTKKKGTMHCGLPVLGKTDTPVDTNADYIIAIGTPQARQKIGENYEKDGATFATLLHPAAYVASTSKIASGTIMAPFSFAGPESVIGKNALLNINSSVAHESTTGDYTVLSPYAGTHANTKIGKACFLGAHSTITRFVILGDQVKVAAGSVVYNNAEDGAEALGNPARFR